MHGDILIADIIKTFDVSVRIFIDLKAIIMAARRGTIFVAHLFQYLLYMRA